MSTCDTTTQSVITFRVSLPPPELRGNSRAHHIVRNRAADAYSEAIYEAYADSSDWQGTPLWLMLPAASVVYVWHYAGARPDIDNIARGVKVLQDTICGAPANGGRNRWYLGLIDDDGAIEPVTFRRQKVAHRADEAIEITITGAL